MIARVVENWLDSATEKEFQLPFCHVLANEGKTIIHITRHCSMEMGKDIIAIDRDGVPCAYQLKSVDGQRLSKDEWRTKLLPQMDELVLQSIDHPAIKSNELHRSYLVINGELDEEVSAAIGQYNSNLRKRKHPKNRCLQVIVRGQLYKSFMALGTDLWPFGSTEERTFLSLYLEPGDGLLSKDKLSCLLERVLQIDSGPPKGKHRISRPQIQRRITSAAILCSLSTCGFTRLNNHAAVFETWVMYTAYTFAVAERHQLPRKFWSAEVEISVEAARQALYRLCEELQQRDNFVEGNPLADVAFYKIRLTYLVGLVALLGLWRIKLNEARSSLDDFCQDFVTRHLSECQLWGEYAVPQFLAINLYLESFDATLRSTQLLGALLTALSRFRQRRGNGQLPDPYCNPEEFVLETTCRGPSERKHNFQDGSFALESVLHLYVKANMKQSMKRLWPDITRVQFKRFYPDELADYYRWNIRNGVTESIFLPPTGDWNNLRRESQEHTGTDIPPLLKLDPGFYLAFLCVFPHRLNSSGVRWLSSKFN